MTPHQLKPVDEVGAQGLVLATGRVGWFGEKAGK
jgi:hypothetical protein